MYIEYIECFRHICYLLILNMYNTQLFLMIYHIIFQIDENQLKKRQEYLRKQRDKLVALKTEERRKQFGKAEGGNVLKKTRPKSAKAAEAVLTGEQSTIPHQELQLRKALAERLKMEVVDKNRK